MRLSKLLKIAAFSAALLGSATALAQSAAPEVVRIGIPSVVGGDGKLLPAFNTEVVSKYLGEQFKDSPAKFELKFIPGAGPGINEALAANAIDFATYGDFPAIVGRSGGLKTKLLLSVERGNNSYLVVPPGSSAASIKDLAGKHVGINRGRPWQLAFSRLLKRNGLKESDVELLNLAPPDGVAALAAGKIDAYYTYDAYPLVEKNIGKIIWSTKPEPLDWKFTAELFSTEQFAAQHPDLTLKVVKAYVQTAYHDGDPANRDERIRGTVAPGTTYEAQKKNFDSSNFRVTLSPLIDPFLRAHYEQAIAYSVENKLIRKSFPVEGWLEPKFVDQAVRELGYTGFWPSIDDSGKVPAYTAPL